MKRARDAFQTPFKCGSCAPTSHELPPAAVTVHLASGDVTLITGPKATPAAVPTPQREPARDAELIEDILYWLDVSQRAVTVLAEEVGQPIEAVLAALSISPHSLLYEDGEFFTKDVCLPHSHPMKTFRALLHRGSQSRVRPVAARRALNAEESERLGAILPHVPTTFTTTSQVARLLARQRVCPETAWDTAAVEKCAQSYPSFFDRQVVGSVVTIRRHATAMAALRGEEAAPPATLSTTSSSPLSATLSLSVAEMEMLTHVFPTFCVPLSALAALPTGYSEHATALIAKYHHYLVVRTPTHDACQPAEDTLNTSPTATAFISLSPAFVQQCARRAIEPTAADARWAAWRVEEYEYLRVARLFPTTRAWVPLTADLVAAAVPLLPAGRDMLHVLFSAPHLFRVRPGAEIGGSPPDGPPLLSARCALDDASVPTVSGDAAALRAALAQLQARRFEKGVRGRRREVQRQLTYVTNPTPLLNERVLAQYLFDLLPGEGSVPVNNLLGGLPEAVRNCLPADLGALWRGREDLFYLYFNGTEMAVQRADAARPAPRSIESVDAMEILQEVYRRYPLSHHPDRGTCLFRLLPKLSPLVRDRLFQLRDVEEFVLRRFPDKVEVLDVDAHLMAQQLTTCKGRTDFFVVFRFVDDWQHRLVRQYEASSMKRHTPKS